MREEAASTASSGSTSIFYKGQSPSPSTGNNDILLVFRIHLDAPAVTGRGKQGQRSFGGEGKDSRGQIQQTN